MDRITQLTKSGRKLSFLGYFRLFELHSFRDAPVQFASQPYVRLVKADRIFSLNEVSFDLLIDGCNLPSNAHIGRHHCPPFLLLAAGTDLPSPQLSVRAG